jgi:hypothetical protein
MSKRKALGDVTESKLNARLNTPGTGLGKTSIKLFKDEDVMKKSTFKPIVEPISEPEIDIAPVSSIYRFQMLT